jgi:cephalosporin-C deacetylase-like acetyl esterase
MPQINVYRGPMRTTAFLLCFSTLLGVSTLCAQSDRPPDALAHWMDHIAQKELDKRDAAIAAIHTVAEAEQRKKYVRQTLMDLMGGFPDYHGPLNARVTGSIKADGYTIEKLIYESLPGFYVSADLYRPDKPGKYPGILLQSGHTQEGKPEPQRLAANLALKGFVSLAFDPIGQGEREQTYDPQLQSAAAGWSVPEHIQAGAQSLLVNEAVGRYFIWDAIRGIDYLVSRPEVDPDKIGAAGCSGGGALTTFTGALDPRVKVVIPACYPNSYRLLFLGPDPDTEMAFPDFLARGLDVADFVEMTAPTPWLIQATEHDYFTPPGAKMVYDEAKHWYKLYGPEDKVGFFVGPGPHGTPLVSREAVYKWMIRWLKEGQGDGHEQPVTLYPNQDLWATSTGHVEDLPGSRKLYQIIHDEYEAKRKPETIDELRAELQRLGIPSYGKAPAVQVVSETGIAGGKKKHIKFESEPGVEIEGDLYLPDSPAGRKPAVLTVQDSPPYFMAATIESLADRMVKAGRIVLALSPRGPVPEDNDRPFMGDWLADSRANQVGLNMPAMRAHDIVRGVDVLAARDDVDPSSIHAMGRSVKGVWLLLAAAADPRIGKIWLDRTPYSLHAALEQSMNTGLFDVVIPGFILHWDFADLVKAMGNRQVIWTDPTKWMGRIEPLGPPFRYRYILGDTTDLADAQDNALLDELMK